MQAEDDLQALAERAVAAIAAPPERGALASMVVAALLRSDPARGLPRLDALPPPYRKLALLRAAQGGAPSPALAARARAELATWEALGDDEAALGLWAGLDLDALGARDLPAPVRELDGYQLGKRMLSWGVPPEREAAFAWLDAHVSGQAHGALTVLVVERRPLPPAGELAPLVARIERIPEALFRLDAVTWLVVRGATSRDDEARLAPLAEAAFAALPHGLALQPSFRGKLATVVARAGDAGPAIDKTTKALAGASPAARAEGLRWLALAHARLGIARWRAHLERAVADPSWFGFKEVRDALLVDALGTARQLPDLLAAADAVHETFRDVLRRLRDPLWKAVALSLLVPLSAVAPGRTPATIVAELVPLLRQIGADASQRDELGRQLPALVERVAPHGEAALVQVFQQLPDPTLRAFGLTHLLEARAAPATSYPRS